MEDVIKSIKAFLYERTASPLFGAFTISWLVWNYRVIAILLDGHATVAEKFSLLDTHFGHTVQIAGHSYDVPYLGHLINGLAAPASLAAAYLYLYPIIAKPVYQHSLHKQKELRDIKQQEEGARLLSAEESRILQKEIEQLRSKADEEADQYRKRIASLTETINSLEEELGKRPTPIPPNPPHPSDNKGAQDQLAGQSNDQRKLPQNELAKFTRALTLLLPKYYAQLADKGREPLLNTQLAPVATYFTSHNLNAMYFAVLAVLVASEGQAGLDSIRNALGSWMSAVEVNHIIDQLLQKNFIGRAGKDIKLHAPGNEFSVSSGLTELHRELKAGLS